MLILLQVTIDNVRGCFSGFLFISRYVSLDLLSLGSVKMDNGCGGKVNGHLMASCVRNIRTKNYQDLVTGFQLTIENVKDVFLGHSVVYNAIKIKIKMLYR